MLMNTSYRLVTWAIAGRVHNAKVYGKKSRRQRQGEQCGEEQRQEQEHMQQGKGWN